MQVTVRHVPGADLAEMGDDVMMPAAWRMTVDREDGAPLLVLLFEVRDGAPQCRALELHSAGDGREVLTKDLRDLRIEDLIEMSVQQFAIVRGGSFDEDGDAGGRRHVVGEVRRARRSSRRSIGPELLTEVARVYRENIDGNPTAAVAAHTEKAHRTAALYVKLARESGFLGQAIPGKKGEK